ncbi:MAG: hypothetical protein HQL46_13065 [Gammaproteobacteria bacterium]|nr:hypothetical protein [Gammaproteobacteria bacterium]
MNTNEYLESIEERLLNIFKLQHQGQKDEKLKFQTEGYMHAGKMLGLVDESQLKTLIEKAHIKVFGKTVEARQQEKQEALMLNPDFNVINIPAFLRKKQQETGKDVE